jgi:hypothetical protein
MVNLRAIGKLRDAVRKPAGDAVSQVAVDELPAKAADGRGDIDTLASLYYSLSQRAIATKLSTRQDSVLPLPAEEPSDRTASAGKETPGRSAQRGGSRASENTWTAS